MSVINFGNFSTTASSDLCSPPLITSLLECFVCENVLIVSLSGYSVQAPITTHFSLCFSVGVISIDLSTASLKRNVFVFLLKLLI